MVGQVGDPNQLRLVFYKQDGTVADLLSGVSAVPESGWVHLAVVLDNIGGEL